MLWSFSVRLEVLRRSDNAAASGLLIIGALLIIAGAAWGPETKDVDFATYSPELSDDRV